MSKLVIIEGGEGSGKSSVIRSLKKQHYFTTREPGGSDFSEVVRSCILGAKETKDADTTALMLCMFGLRKDHIEKTIKPALEKGVVVCDRFDGSTYAYQVNPSNEALFWLLRKHIIADLNIEYIYLDIDPKIGLKRKQTQMEWNVFEDMKLDFHIQVSNKFKTFFSKCPNSSHVVDATQPLEVVIEKCIRLIEK